MGEELLQLRVNPRGASPSVLPCFRLVHVDALTLCSLLCPGTWLRHVAKLVHDDITAVIASHPVSALPSPFPMTQNKVFAFSLISKRPLQHMSYNVMTPV